MSTQELWFPTTSCSGINSLRSSKEIFSLTKTGNTRETPVNTGERGFPTDFAFKKQLATTKECQK